ncbi:MAG: potassium uptake protein, TrkH family [Oscillospiraceae bacterium]|nr:potassium uptake protein, TrkH family [Oscillospiraceae bacterium]
MSIRIKLYRMWGNRSRFRLSTTQIIAIAFAAIILLGACLLMLPISSRDGRCCGLRPALFTATSATCVTGLVLYDTWTQWSAFGQAVLLCLIEVGGLGFMSAASMVIFFLHKKVGLKQRMVMAQALSLNDMQGVVRLQKTVLFGSLSIQGLGALILFARFLPGYGLKKALWWGVFHSISAFCNAGFDVFGSINPGASIITFNADPVVCVTLMALVTVGGLGFFVWQEVAAKRSWKKISVYTKLVLLTSGVLILGGAAAFCLLEWNNPATLGPMSIPQKILNGFFQSVTVRTAGFAGVDQAGLTEAGKAVSIVLMLIGGSSGSTAGGVKTVTMVVLLLFLRARATGRQTVTVFKRTVPSDKVLDAMTIVTIVVGLAMFGGVFITATSPVGFTDALYESVSALATVGLTAGVTGSLSIPAQLLIIIYMYFGRVGVLTISLGFLIGDKTEDRFRYAHTNLLIG